MTVCSAQVVGLFRCPFGSHLYGTSGPTSDIDIKVVYLPALDDLLMNRSLGNYKVTQSESPTAKILPGETEVEYLPLQLFLDDFFNGQTYAIEVALAAQQKLGTVNACYAASFVPLIDELVTRFLTSNTSKMVGYAVAQAQNYGLKTQRYAVLKQFISTVEAAAGGWSAGVRPLDTPALVDSLVAQGLAQRIMIANAAGGAKLAPALEVNGRSFSLTTRWPTIMVSLQKAFVAYGERVKQFAYEGTDWKALSHAIRITEQVLELNRTGTLKFPRPTATYLRAVKEGRIPLTAAIECLTARFDEITEAKAKSVLIERTPELEWDFDQFKLRWLRELYGQD